MAKRVEGRSDRLLQCARADTSTGSIYTRFGDKEGLFHALVVETIEAVTDWFQRGQQDFDALSPARKRGEVVTYAADRWEEPLGASPE